MVYMKGFMVISESTLTKNKQKTPKESFDVLLVFCLFGGSFLIEDAFGIINFGDRRRSLNPKIILKYYLVGNVESYAKLSSS